jgi:hypothetical protein
VNRDEAIALCRYVKACCPQQAIDEYTPDAWADHLADVPYADAKEACRQITARQPFVTIAEVLGIVKSIRSKRIAEAGDLTPPRGLTDEEERAWLGEARRRIADGETLGELHGGRKPHPELAAKVRELLPSPPLHPEPTPTPNPEVSAAREALHEEASA